MGLQMTSGTGPSHRGADPSLSLEEVMNHSQKNTLRGQNLRCLLWDDNTDRNISGVTPSEAEILDGTKPLKGETFTGLKPSWTNEPIEEK